MGRFLALYGGDILVSACILAGVISVIRSMHRDKKAGKGSCSSCPGCSGCSSCSSCSNCHK